VSLSRDRNQVLMSRGSGAVHLLCRRLFAPDGGVHSVDQRYRCGAALTRIEPGVRAAWLCVPRCGRIAIKAPPTAVATARLMAIRGCAAKERNGQCMGEPGLSPDDVLVMAGGTEALTHALTVVTKRGDAIAIQSPTAASSKRTSARLSRVIDANFSASPRLARGQVALCYGANRRGDLMRGHFLSSAQIRHSVSSWGTHFWQASASAIACVWAPVTSGVTR
jgi:hypothetical protein